MGTITIKRGDTLLIKGVYKQNDGTIMNLTGYTLEVNILNGTTERPAITLVSGNSTSTRGVVITNTIGGEFVVTMKDTEVLRDEEYWIDFKAVGGGCGIKWLPSYDADKLYIVRGNGTANIYTYSLSGNTFATQTFYPSTETYTTSSAHTARSIAGKGYSIISSKDATMRIYEYDPSLSRLHPKMNQWLYPTGAAVQGDRATCLRSPDEVEFYYLLLPSSTAFVRCALIDS